METVNPSEKKTYYVTVGSAEILEPEDMIGNFDFEIQATEEDIDKLEELFDDTLEADDASAVRAHVPYVHYHHDKENDQYDFTLKQIYRLLYELGTPETKKHIEQMRVLQ